MKKIVYFREVVICHCMIAPYSYVESVETSVTRSPEALCRAVIFYVLYFIYIFFSCYIFTKVQLLWLLHSSGPSP